MTDAPEPVRPRQPPSEQRKWLYRVLILATILLSPFLLTAFGQPRPKLGVESDSLTPCGQRPNCCSSDSRFLTAKKFARLLRQPEPEALPSYVEPYELKADADSEWNRLTEIAAKQRGMTVLEKTGRYFRGERRSLVYGFIDDFEMQRLFNGTVLVRSAARLGYSDLGANRRLIERIRTEFASGPAR